MQAFAEITGKVIYEGVTLHCLSYRQSHIYYSVKHETMSYYIFLTIQL